MSHTVFSAFASISLNLNLYSCLSRFSNVYFVDATTADTIDTDLIAEGGTLDWLAG